MGYLDDKRIFASLTPAAKYALDKNSKEGKFENYSFPIVLAESDKVLPIPKALLNGFTRVHPHVWEKFDWLVERAKQKLSWPDYCVLPTEGWNSFVKDLMPEYHEFCKKHFPDPTDVIRDAAFNAAVYGSWRLTQGIFRFDETIFNELIKTDADVDIPASVLRKLPYWCVYVETSGDDLSYGLEPIYGFFAFIDYMAATGKEYICIHAIGRASFPISIRLDGQTISQSVNTIVKRLVDRGLLNQEDSQNVQKNAIEFCKKAISLLLYLCSQNAEIGTDLRKPFNPVPIKTKKGMRIFPPDKPTTWDVGVRLGAALRSAYTKEAQECGGTHARPRAHIRRAHWHSFWTGPMKGERTINLKWMPPIPVNVDSVENLPAVIRPVEADTSKMTH